MQQSIPVHAWAHSKKPAKSITIATICAPAPYLTLLVASMGGVLWGADLSWSDRCWRALLVGGEVASGDV